MSDKHIIDIFKDQSILDLLKHQYDLVYKIAQDDAKDPFCFDEKHIKHNENRQSWVEAIQNEIQRRFEELEKQLQDGEG